MQVPTQDSEQPSGKTRLNRDLLMPPFIPKMARIFLLTLQLLSMRHKQLFRLGVSEAGIC